MHTSSTVVNHLQTIFEEDEKVAVLCVYCNYKDQIEQTVSNLVASLLKQIVQDLRACVDSVKPLYTRHENQDTRPTLDEFTQAFEAAIGAYSKVFIVVDALDECREDDATRAKFLRVLRSLPENVNLMVTSRNLPSIARDFDGIERLNIRAHDEDIRMYIEGRIALAPRHLKALQETIANKIVENAKGM